MNKKNIIVLLLAIVVWGWSGPAFAVENPTSSGFLGDINQQLGVTAGKDGADLGEAQDPRLIVALIVRYAIGVLGVLFLAYTVYAGYIILSAAGNSDRIEEGRATLRRAVIGLIIILNAYALSWWVSVRLARISGLDTSEYIKIEEDRTKYRLNDPLYEGNPATWSNCQRQPDGSQKCF